MKSGEHASNITMESERVGLSISIQHYENTGSTPEIFRNLTILSHGPRPGSRLRSYTVLADECEEI